MTMEAKTPNVGSRVITSDGKDLGKVKQVEGTCFKLDAPMQPDYWLGMDTVGSTSTASVQLSISSQNLLDEVRSEVKDRGPEHGGYHRH
jgi:hypothetical protein